MRILDKLSGKKTYLIAAATIIYAVLGVYFGDVEADQAIYVVLGSLGLAGLRDGVRKLE